LPSKALTETLERFWHEHPALVYGIAYFLGCVTAIDWHWELLIFYGAFWPALFWTLYAYPSLVSRFLIAINMFVGAFSFSHYYFNFPEIPPEGIQGQGIFSIKNFTKSRTHFGTFWIYQGTLQTFSPLNGNKVSFASHIPCKIALRVAKGSDFPKANRSYQVVGNLKENKPGNYSLTVKKNSPWLPLVGSWSLAEMRHQTKNSVAAYIHRHIHHRKSAEFLSGLATGEFSDKLMAYELSRFGLQHIMAISGFHFSILVILLSFLLRLLLSKKRMCWILTLILAGYCLYLGGSSSVFRAWIMSTVVLIGCLLEKQGNGLNSLGIALIALLAINPLAWNMIGFQFSFGITATILLFYGCFDFLLKQFFLKNSLSYIVKLPLLHQHGYYFLIILRKALALMFAVNCIGLPLSLYHFHKFPMMSLFYNLFFPFLTSFAILLLLLGILFPFLGFHALNSYYTEWMLGLVYKLPNFFDFVCRTNVFPEWALGLYLCFLFYGAIFLKKILRDRQNIIEDFEFL
jgi:competence protein ComEC